MTKAILAATLVLTAAFLIGASGAPGWALDLALEHWGAPAVVAPYL